MVDLLLVSSVPPSNLDGAPGSALGELFSRGSRSGVAASAVQVPARWHTRRARARPQPDRRLRRFYDDGRPVLTKNGTERAIKAIAFGRKAWLFCGSDSTPRAPRPFISSSLLPAYASSTRGAPAQHHARRAAVGCRPNARTRSHPRPSTHLRVVPRVGRVRQGLHALPDQHDASAQLVDDDGEVRSPVHRTTGQLGSWQRLIGGARDRLSPWWNSPWIASSTSSSCFRTFNRWSSSARRCFSAPVRGFALGVPSCLSFQASITVSRGIRNRSSLIQLRSFSSSKR